MADNDPRSAVKAPGFNTWGYAGIPKENDFYDFLDDVKQSTDEFFETVNLIFELVNTALDFIASLLIDFSNPLKPIIEQIIATLNAFVNDLRNLGLYITYDRKQIDGNPSEDLLGGYQAFEQRLTRKLLDISDPSRPNFAPETKVFALTLFAGGDASSLSRVIAYIKKLIKFFTPVKDEPPQAPINVEAVYYNDIIGEVDLTSRFKPDGFRVKWKLPPPVSTSPAFPTSFFPPNFFLFSVATRNSNDVIGYINCIEREPSDPKTLEGKTLKSNLFRFQKNKDLADARLWPLVGSFSDKLDEDETYAPLDESPDSLESGDKALVLYNGDEVYLSKVNGEKPSDIYKCFIFNEEREGSVIGDGDFHFDIPLDNLKVQGELKEEYFITIYSLIVTQEDFNQIEMTKSPLPNIRTNQIGGFEVEYANLIKLTDDGNGTLSLDSGDCTLTLPSNTVVVKSPSELKEKYIKTLRFFFLAFLLGRLDNQSNLKLSEIELFTKDEADFINRFANLDVGFSTLKKKSFSKQKFAKEVVSWIDHIVDVLKDTMPSDNVLISKSDDLDKITNFPYDLYDLLKKASKGQGIGEGIFPNTSQFILTTKFDDTKGKSISGEDFNLAYDQVVLSKNARELKDQGVDINSGTTPIFFYGDFVNGLVPHNSVVLKSTSDKPLFFGNLIFLKDFVATFKLARPIVLLSDTNEEKGNWINFKPMRDTDLSSLLGVIEIVKKYLEGFLKGLEGLVAQILKFIHMLKTRIAQLQDTIRKIKRLIDIILSLRFPAGLYGTFHLADGTTGLINALQQTTDKPDIGIDGYGTGLMAVGGGVPSILVDLFIAMLGGSIDEITEGG